MSAPDLAALRSNIWGAAQEMLARVLGAWIGPEFVAGLGRITRQEQREILAWLLPLERLARMLIRSAHIVAPAAAPNARDFAANVDARRANEPSWFSAESGEARQKALTAASSSAQWPNDRAQEHAELDPSTWRVRFRLGAAPLGRARGYGCRGFAPAERGPRGPAADTVDAWPIARRIEAAIRVVEDPSGYAAWISGAAPHEPSRSSPEAKQVRAVVEARSRVVMLDEAERLLAQLEASGPGAPLDSG